jgi:hypothetical protein
MLDPKREARENKNIGPVIYDPEVGALDAVLLVERLLKSLLQTTTNWLKNDEAATRKFFSHFFDSTVPEAEREEFIANFIRKPPKTILGYARALPDNMFMRVVRVHTKQAFSAPRILLTDPTLQRLVGLYMNDINVDGFQGGVVPVTITLDED